MAIRNKQFANQGLQRYYEEISAIKKEHNCSHAQAIKIRRQRLAEHAAKVLGGTVGEFNPTSSSSFTGLYAAKAFVKSVGGFSEAQEALRALQELTQE